MQLMHLHSHHILEKGVTEEHQDDSHHQDNGGIAGLDADGSPVAQVLLAAVHFAFSPHKDDTFFFAGGCT